MSHQAFSDQLQVSACQAARGPLARLGRSSGHLTLVALEWLFTYMARETRVSRLMLFLKEHGKLSFACMCEFSLALMATEDPSSGSAVSIFAF